MEVHGFVHVITEVFYIPDLKNNLLSIGQLKEKGLIVLIQHGICKIFHKEKGLIMETEIQNVHCAYSLHTKGTKMLLLTNHRSSRPLALSVWTSHLEWAQSAPTKEHGDRVTSV